MKGKINFKPVNQVSAATGVKISAVDIKEVISGMPLLATEDVENAKEQIKKEVEETKKKEEKKDK